MSLLLKVFKYTLFSAAVSLATCVIGLFLAILLILNRDSAEDRPIDSGKPRGSISDIAAARPDPHALPPSEMKEADQTSKYHDAIEKLKTIGSIEEDSKKAAAVNLCEIICDKTQIKSVYSDVLSLYHKEGRESFRDPDFRLQLEALYLIKGIFPAQTMEVVSDMAAYRGANKPWSEKLWKALQMEGQVIKELYLMARRIPVIKAQHQKLQYVKSLRKECTPENTTQTRALCKKQWR